MKIGVISTRRDVFSKEAAKSCKRELLKFLKEQNLFQVIDIEDINEEGLLFQEKDVQSIVSKMRAAHVDGVMFVHCNFGSEDLVGKIAAALEVPVLLWGPRDDAPLADGCRTRDTQCGLFAAGKVLRRFGVTFTYLENSRISDSVFAQGFKDFAAVCGVVSSFRHLRILQLGTRPASFWSVMCNEGELLEKFGIQIVPVSLLEFTDRVKNKLKVPEKLKETLSQLEKTMDVSAVPEKKLQLLASLKETMKELCADTGSSCAAIQCWNALKDDLGIMPCAVNGLMAEEGIPVVCETDIHGAVTAILLQAAVQYATPVFFADLTVRHPENDNAELLWHCGNFPPSLAREDAKKVLGKHFIFPDHLLGTGEWELKRGDITICRFDGDHGDYRLLVGEGRSVAGPRTRGTYVWFEVDDWKRWERKLVEGPYVHHCAGAYGHCAGILEEACRYIPNLNVERA